MHHHLGNNWIVPSNMLNLNPYSEVYVDNDTLTYVRTSQKVNDTASQTTTATGKIRCSAFFLIAKYVQILKQHKVSFTNYTIGC